MSDKKCITDYNPKTDKYWNLLWLLFLKNISHAFNLACYNFVESNFLLKEHDFPFQRSQLCILPSCRRQGAMLSHSPHSAIKSSYLGCNNCNQLQKMASVDWSLQQLRPNLALLWFTWHVTVRVCYSQSLLASIYSLYPFFKHFKCGFAQGWVPSHQSVSPLSVNTLGRF